MLAVLGEEEFRILIGDYLSAHPPTRPSIFHAGEFLGDFADAHPRGDRFRFLADLARLERALIEAFHAPDAPVLTEGQLRAIEPSKWPALAMRTHPTVRIIRSQWRVAGLKRAIDDQHDWREPARETLANPDLAAG